jgi:hypothetical protein
VREQFAPVGLRLHQEVVAGFVSEHGHAAELNHHR